jgi:hypothetical protein
MISNLDSDRQKAKQSMQVEVRTKGFSGEKGVIMRYVNAVVRRI